MEQIRHGRGGQDSGALTASLTGNAQVPAGSRFSEGVSDNRAASPGGGPTSGWNEQTAVVPPLQDKPQPFYKKRWFIICQIITALIGIIMIFILLFPVVKAVAQLLVNKSTLSVDVAAISSPQNNTFQLALQGHVSHTGLISAQIHFPDPVQVSWVHDGEVTPIGNMRLDTLSAKHASATINQTTTFMITDEDAFGQFAGTMITAQNFTWRLESNSLRVNAVKFPVAKGIKFSKDLTLNGFNSFNGNVLLKDFQLPSDNPAGGIDFVAVTELTNPSPFSLNLGTVLFELSYLGLPLGIGTGTNTVIAPGTNDITLKGYLKAHTDENDLKTVSQLFNNYLNGLSSPVIAKGVSTLQNDNSSISWLSQGLQSLSLNVPFKSFVDINPIQGITIGDFALAFTDETPWNPQANSNSVHATLQLPFGFGLKIGEIQNDLNITKDGLTVAGLSTPLGASTSEISVLGPTDTAGSINITIANTLLTVVEENHSRFSEFNANLTSQQNADFRLEGVSHAIANTSIGTLALDVKVNVTSGLLGLQGLKGLTTINSVDVLGGTKDAINLGINLTINNPSNLHLATGDLNLALFRDGVQVGTVLLPNLTLAMGNNTLSSSSAFDANASPQGLQTLGDFVGGTDVALTVTGYGESTKVASLLQAFETLDIGVSLPALQSKLLDSASLIVLPTTGRTNNISHVSVVLNNPFTTPLDITKIASSVKYKGILLGNIESTDHFTTAPKTQTTSPQLDLNMNFDPATLFTVTRMLAVEAGLDTAPLDAIVQLGGISYLSEAGVSRAIDTPERRDNLFTGFNLPSYVQSAFKKLNSDVELSVDVTLGEYATSLQYTQNTVPTKTDDTLDLILPVLAAPIVQKMVSGSVLSLSTILISDPQQNIFNTALKGSITQAGPFDAKIAFGGGLQVKWNGQILGSIKMDDVSLAGDVGAQLDMTSAFQVADVDHLTAFTKVLLTEESFDWEISGENLTVSALGIDVTGISLTSKTVTLKGFNGLKNGVVIKTFDLPSNDPAGGIHLTLEADTTNPSQVGIELSSIAFDTYVGDVLIAPVSSGKITLSPGGTSPLALVGRLIPQSSSEGLQTVSDIFNNFVQGKDSNVQVRGAAAGPSDVTWLNEAITSLSIATVLPNRGPLTIINSIKLNDLTLLFSEDAAYNPPTSSSSTDAAFGLPFAFPIDITALEQTITVGWSGTDFASLALPKAPSKTNVETRVIALSFSNVPFAVFNDQHGHFNDFVAATTVGKTQTLRLSGSANADASTAVGVLSLTGIDFAVNSDIEGLQGLNTKPTIVSNLDVAQGFPDYLLINTDSSIFNPSNLTIGTGDVSFSLQFEDQTIGTADISNLLITPGDKSISIGVHYSPQGGAVAAGRDLLQNYIQGVDSATTIAGTTDSTNIDSLKEALSQIRLTPVSIPALNKTLISSTSLTFPVDITKTGIAAATFTLDNPFTASINLLKISSTVTFHGINLGSINAESESNPIHADGHSSVTSPTLPLAFNLDPLVIIQLLTLTAAENNVDLGPLVQLFQVIVANPDYHPPVTTTVDTSAPTCVSGGQFDFSGAILKSLAGLKIDLDIVSSTKLDEFATDLAFKQTSVPAVTDQTALFLVGAVAAPVAQVLVDGSILAFTEANITNISDEGFDLSLVGSLKNIGPLDALIEFVEPLDVQWNGNKIAQIALPPVCAAANTGVPVYTTTARLTITDLDGFTTFATFLLHNPSFDWTISTPKLRLTALGTIFDNVSLSKTVSFKAFNGLPGVTISNFQLPGDAPNGGGIQIETDALIPSPSQIGIDLGTVGFTTFFNGVEVGPLTGTGLSLAPNSNTQTHLSGSITPKSGSDLDTIGTLFSGYLAGENQTLVTRGDSVQPAGSSQPVSWLSTAFKTLELQVILPGQKLTVIQSIALNDLSVTLQDDSQTFAPPTSSSHTLAKYANPFGFSLQVLEAAQDIILNSQGIDLAELKIPLSPASGGVSTGNVVDLEITWQDVPMTSLNNDAFPLLFAGVTLLPSVDLLIKGTAQVLAKTAIGNVPISGIPLNVPSSIKGIASFGGKAGLSDIVVKGSGGNGGTEYILAPVTTTLQNPSNISLSTVDISLPVLYKGVVIGRAAINPFNLVPGTNVVPGEFHYQPVDANDTVAQSFLSEFVQTSNTLDLTIEGDANSTPFASLQPALGGLKLAASLTGLNQPTLIQDITVEITLDTFVTNLVSINFDIHNPFEAELILDALQVSSGLDGLTYAFAIWTFDGGLAIPPGATVNSGTIPNVLLTQGVDASLVIIPEGILDVFTAATLRIGQDGVGYTVPWLQLQQKSVPTVYNFVLDGLSLKQAAQVANGTSSSTQPSSTSSGTNSTETSTTITSASDQTSAQTSADVTTAPAETPTKTTETEQTTVASTEEKPATTAATKSTEEKSATAAAPESTEEKPATAEAKAPESSVTSSTTAASLS